MNKWFKRIGALVLSATLALSGMALSASAETTALPDTTTARSLTIHKYALDDLSTADAKNNTGLELEADDLPEGAKPLAGIKFDVFDTIDSTAYAALSETDQAKYTELDETGYYFDADSAPKTTLTTETDGSIKYELGTTNGVYAIVEQENSQIESPIAPFVVSVPMTNPTDGEAWIYDVHVYPKNSPLGIDKSVDSSNADEAYVPSKGASYGLGDAFDWRITSDIPAEIATYKDYTINDPLDGRLTYVSTTVKLGETTLTAGTDYILTTTAGTDANGRANTTVKVEFKTDSFDGRAKLADYLTAEGSDKKVTVFINTVLNSLSGIYTIDNKAILDVTNKNDETSHPETPDNTNPKVYVGGFGIDKYEKGDTEKKLAGAEFKLALTEDDAKAGTFIQKLKADTTVAEDTEMADGSVVKAGTVLPAGTLIYTGDPYYNTEATEDYTVTTNANGQAIFSGLKLNIETDPKTGEITKDNGMDYYLVETKAPAIAGTNPVKYYNLLDSAKKVTVKYGADDSTMTIGEDVYKNVSSIEEIANSKGFTLPLTGGTGTAIFTAAGIVMAGLGVCLFITMKKKKANAAA